MRGPMLAVVFVTGLVAVGAAVASANGRWSTHLQGDNESPPVATLAQGQAILKLAPDGESLEYKLIASNNGGIVVWLYPSAPPLRLIPGPHAGVLAEGTVTEANFVGALAGRPFSALVDALESGLAYANVHTVANPPGEIRGNVR